MIKNRQPNIFPSLAEGLKLKHAELGLLIDTLSQQTNSYDFFRILTSHIIPLIRQNESVKTLVSRWERKTRASHKELKKLEGEALEEVTAAYDLLAKPGALLMIGDETQKHVDSWYKKLPFIKNYFKDVTPVSPPIELIP